MRTILIAIFLIVLTPSLALAAPSASAHFMPGGRFETGTPPFHWRSSAKVRASPTATPDGRRALHLPAGARSECILNSVAVQGGRRYSLRLIGKVAGPGAIAQDMAVDSDHAVQRLLHTHHLAGWSIAFTDADGKPVKSLHPWVGLNFIHTQWTPCRTDFYAPPGAAGLSLVLSNGDKANDVWIDAIQLLPLEGPLLNINPDISLGNFNFSGYNYIHQVRIGMNKAGDGYLDCSRGWVIGDPIPVEDTTYRFSFKGRQTGVKQASARIHFYDSAMKGLGRTHLIRVGVDWTEKSYAFIPPDKTAFVRIVFGAGDFDWFRLQQAMTDARPGKTSE